MKNEYAVQVLVALATECELGNCIATNLDTDATNTRLVIRAELYYPNGDTMEAMKRIAAMIAKEREG